MFRASSRPSSGAQQLQWQPLVLPLERGDSSAVGRGRAGNRPDHDQQTLEAKRLRGRPRNRWKDEVREDGRIAVGEGWKERAYNREEWTKLLRTARNRRILHMPME